MIKPLLSPTTITGNATTGLISAARSGLRNIQKSTETISKAPDVTKEQGFGMNYIGFFGSKKVGKDLFFPAKIAIDTRWGEFLCLIKEKELKNESDSL